MHSEALHFFLKLLGASTSIGQTAVHFPQCMQVSSSTLMQSSEQAIEESGSGFA